MASTTYAAVHVGSNELCMKIYEMSRQNGIRQLTYVRHPLSLGAESYTEGVISYQTLSEICNTLNDFKRIMTEFHTDSCEDRKSTRLNSSHIEESRMPSSA